MGYDLLGDLGVSIPVSGVSAPSKATDDGHKIMRPSVRAPRTPRSDRSEAGSTTTTGTVPGGEATDRIIHMSPARGLRVPPPNQVFQQPERTILITKGRTQHEYEVYNSAVPSNLAYNAKQSKVHQAKSAIQRERDHQAAVARVQADKESIRAEKALAAEKKHRQQQELTEWNDWKVDHDSQVRAEESARDRRHKDAIMERYEQEVDKKRQSLIQQQRSKEIWREELQRLISDKSKKESEKHTSRLSESYPGLVIGTLPEPKSVTRSRSKKLQHSWDEQLQYKEEIRQAERIRAANQSARLQEQDKQKQQRDADEKLMKKIKNMKFTQEQKAACHERANIERIEKARETHIDRERVERSRSVGDQIKRDEAMAKRSKSQTFRESLINQITDRARASAAKQQERLKPGITHNGLGTAEPRKILLRCPETGQLLPPSAFNLHFGPKPRLRVP